MNIGDWLVREVRRYLVGPRESDEVLQGQPADHYTSGILFPGGAGADTLDKDDFEGGSGADEEGSDGQTRPQTKQSSMGLLVDIRDGVDSMDLEIDYAKYRRTESGWKRIPLAPSKRNHTISLGERGGLIKICGNDGGEEAELRWVLDEGDDGHEHYRVLSCFLSNTATWHEYRGGGDYKSVMMKNSHGTIFQPSIRIHSAKPAFRNYRPYARGGLRTAEDESLDLLFADTVSFGRGSNCAAVWEPVPEPRWVQTEFVPEYTAYDIGKDSDGSDGRPGRIDMHRLSYADGDDDGLYRRQFGEAIRPIIDSYGRWIDAEEQKIHTDRNIGFRTGVAEKHIRACRNAHTRMENGLEFLLDGPNEKIRLAFALANRAMLYQRLHYGHALKVAGGGAPDRRPDTEMPGAAFWYPFQLAFLVMNIRGMAGVSPDERETVDLLWFPTGGGKTEAYLAVAAFAMIYRRMRGDGNSGAGVSVIMRYTLRLLTLQQFERASTLVCALEYIRQNNPKYGLGDDPFLIGLWVGQSLTPNTPEDSEKAIRDERRGSRHSKTSPVQHTHCPWCGTGVDAYCYGVDRRTSWTVAHCKNKKCFFSSRDKTETRRALPVLTVDADIYRRCPAMVIATVDKFARMPYDGRIASLFGRVDRYCERHGFLTPGDGCGAARHNDGTRVARITCPDGPDLIIQDELHLITGPLGSMVGLYETAVDYLSRRGLGDGSTGPKIIAATATIRGADDQVRRIFNRRPPHKFPPPGIRRNDSFFWWEKGNGRRYVGTSFSHRSAKYSLARIYASLLQTAQAISDDAGTQVVDPYWTLVGYFNSRRELGGAIRLVEDDVVSNIMFIADTLGVGRHKRPPGKPHDGLEELTGKISQAGIRDIREKLGRTADSQGCISTLLATNMISVGIDVERLGMMVVNGQTKSVSEYIQATGRIGRRPGIPGLVFTLYNPYKPRDLSHYEDFTGYHSMLQRYVEPSTLTPFSVGSIERGMHAVLISMVRLSTPHLADNKSAGRLEMDHAADAISFMLERYGSVQQVGPDTDGYRHTQTYIKAFVDNWQRRVRRERGENARTMICYSRQGPEQPGGGKPVAMLEYNVPGSGTNDFPKVTPNSLRNVEDGPGLYYQERPA